MGRLATVILILVLPLLVLAASLAGCGGTESETRNVPYQPSQPPPGWLEQKQEARSKVPKPGSEPSAPATP